MKKTPEVFYLHSSRFEGNDRLSRITICGMVDEKGVCTFGFSACSTADKNCFSREIGRRGALARVITKPFYKLQLDSEKLVASFKELADKAIAILATKTEAAFKAKNFTAFLSANMDAAVEVAF